MTVDETLPWISPYGGLGDALMLSGVLQRSLEQFPDRRFNMVQRTKYRPIFLGHPAIATMGFPPKEAQIIRTDYWSQPEYGQARAFQILAGLFGLTRPVEERLYLPGIPADDPLFHEIPLTPRTIVIAPASDSPRKEMAAERWHTVVARLTAEGHGVIQVGRLGERPIRGAYSLLGLTTPQQLAALIGRCRAVVTSDNFILHVAHLMAVPAVVLWGATRAETYGYAGQNHLRMAEACPEQANCLGPRSNGYALPCPLGPERHCLNRIAIDDILAKIRGVK